MAYHSMTESEVRVLLTATPPRSGQGRRALTGQRVAYRHRRPRSTRSRDDQRNRGEHMTSRGGRVWGVAMVVIAIVSAGCGGAKHATSSAGASSTTSSTAIGSG